MIKKIIAILLTIVLYQTIKVLAQRYPRLRLNPLILTTISMMILLMLFNIPVERYQEDARFLTNMIAPTTVAFAIPVYKHFQTVKKYLSLLIVSTLIGSTVAILSTISLALLFNLDDHLIISLLPRSITTPFALEMAGEIGGIPALAIVFVIITGLLGVLISPTIFQCLKINSPIAKGIALGMAAHAIGTTGALEYGEEAVTFSTLAMVFAGVITTLFGLTVLPLLINLVL